MNDDSVGFWERIFKREKRVENIKKREPQLPQEEKQKRWNVAVQEFDELLIGVNKSIMP